VSHKLTKRQVRSIKKTFAHKADREERKEQRRASQADRALAPRRTPRRKDWLGDEEYASREAMRRIRQEAKAPDEPAPEAPPEATGTVLEVRAGDSIVSFAGRTLRALLAPNARLAGERLRSPVAVGDRVELEAIDAETVRIVAVQARRSALLREVHDPSRRNAVTKDQVIAANIDQLFIVCSPAAPPFRPGLIDRYLVAASRDGLTPIVCLNKSDLGVSDAVEESLAGYERLGVRVLRVSALSGEGLDELRSCLSGRVSLFAGHSGVGKSSLLNALEPGLALRVGEVTQAAAGQGKGRHTTSSARLVPLSLPETFVVDSPGIRAFSVRGIAAAELGGHFADIDAVAPECAFRNCLHLDKAGCAVAAAAARDVFLAQRLASYRSMLGELG
jgi:ribosome biogenesis GTPase